MKVDLEELSETVKAVGFIVSRERRGPRAIAGVVNNLVQYIVAGTGEAELARRDGVNPNYVTTLRESFRRLAGYECHAILSPMVYVALLQPVHHLIEEVRALRALEEAVRELRTAVPGLFTGQRVQAALDTLSELRAKEFAS